MYLEHFGLRRSPFTTDPDPRLFHPLRGHVEAVEALAEALRKPGVTLLLGPAGAGKSMILATLAAELRERVQLAVIGRLERSQGGFYDALARAFGIESGGGTARTRARLQSFLEHLRSGSHRAAVAIDDSDSLPDSWLAELAQFTADASSEIPIVLVARRQPGALSQRPIAAEVRARIHQTIAVDTFDARECEGFLRALLMAAGARTSGLFEPDAVAALHELSEGLPGRVAEISDRALLVAYGRGADRVGLEATLAAAEQLAGGRRAPHAGSMAAPAAGDRREAPIELHRHGFNVVSRPPVEWPVQQVVGGEPLEVDGRAPGGVTVEGRSFDGPVSMAGSGPGSATGSGPEAMPPRPRVVVGSSPPKLAGGAPPAPGNDSFHGDANGWPIDPEKEREILSGIRRPDRPSWDRAKHDPHRGELAQAPPFGPEMLAVLSDPHGRVAEWFRVLRLRLEDWIDEHQESKPIVMISSAEAGAGKTFVATNLALLFANEPGLRVLLVEADMRRPRFEALFGVPSRPGLADVLAGRTDLSKAVQYISEVGLHVLPGGRPGNPRDLVSPDRLAPTMREMREMADLVIVDSPSMNSWVDARSISLVVDGVMMVTRSGRTRAGELVRSIRSLDPGKLIGAVLNDLEDHQREH